MSSMVLDAPVKETFSPEQIEGMVQQYEAAAAEVERLRGSLIALTLKYGRQIGEGESRQLGRAKVVVSAGSLQLDHAGAVAYIRRYRPALVETLIEDSVRVPAWKKAVQDAKIPNDVAVQFQTYKASSKSLKIAEVA